AGLVEGRWGRIEAFRWTPSQLRQLVAAGFASMAALFINPFGWRLVVYPFEYASKISIGNVEEWSSVNFHDAYGSLVMILLIGLLTAALVSQHRWHLADVALLFLALYSGLTYIRFLFFVAIIAAPLLAKLLDFIPSYEPEMDKPVLNAVIMGIAIFWVAKYFPSPTPAALE